MNHYFIESKGEKQGVKTIAYAFAGRRFTFTTHDGLFSKDHVDPATDILLHTVPPLSGSLLDLGCGYGCIGIVLAKTYSLALTQADVNGAAVEAAKANCAANGVVGQVVQSDCFSGISGTFNTITLNPPIHAGKEVTYRMYEEAADFLQTGGRFYVVTLKKHGAESTLAKLQSVFGNCETLRRKKGYYVFCCTKTV